MTFVNPEPPVVPPFVPVVEKPSATAPVTRVALVGVATAALVAALGAPLGLLWVAIAPSVPVVRTANGAALTEAQPEQFIAADGWFSLLGLVFGVLVAVAAWFLLRGQRGPVGLLAVVAGGLGAAPLAWQLGRRIGLAEYRRLLETAPIGEIINRPPDLRAGRFEWLWGVLPTLQGNLLLPAFAAAVTYTLLAGWSRYAGLVPEPEPAYAGYPYPGVTIPGGYPAVDGYPPVAAGYPPVGPAGPGQPPFIGQPPFTGQPAGGPVSSGWPAPPVQAVPPAPPAPGEAGSSRD